LAGRVAGMPTGPVIAEQRHPEGQGASRAVVWVRLAVDRVVGDFLTLGHAAGDAIAVNNVGELDRLVPSERVRRGGEISNLRVGEPLVVDVVELAGLHGMALSAAAIAARSVRPTSPRRVAFR